MRKTGLSLFLLLILVGSLFPLIPIYAEEPIGSWDNRYSYTVDYGNGTHKSTFNIGPQVFWDSETGSWGELKFQDLGNGYLLENSMITAYVYEWYTVFYDPDNQRVSVDDERWIVEVYGKNKKWREVDLYEPSLSYSNNATHLTVTRSFDCAEGKFNVTYILWQGSRLKHDISFRSKMEGNNQFRVTMKLMGIYSNKVKHSTGEETITSEKHIVSPFFVFGEDNNNLVFSEYLWKLGETNETTGEWTPTTLKDVVLDTSAKGSKMDIIIGNYTLAENESLLIDPDSDTWQVGAGSDDCFGYPKATMGVFYLGLNYLIAGSTYEYATGARFVGVTIPKDSNIVTAYFRVTCYLTQSGTTVNTDLDGQAAGDTITFSDGADYIARPRTNALVPWDSIPAWTKNTAYTSPNIESVIQEIVTRGDWSSGNALVIFWEDGGSTSTVATKYVYSHDGVAVKAPELVVTWEEAGGAEYYRYTAQTISWIGSNSRDWTLSRTFSQGLTFTGDSSRTWSLSRALTQTLTFTSNALVDLLEFIQATASIGLTFSSDSSREWSLKRVLSQGLNLVSNGERVFEAVRKASNSLSATMGANRVFSAVRGVSQTLTAEFNIDRTFSAFRDVSQSISTSLNVNRVFTAIRGVSKTLTAAISASRTWDLSRTVTQTITFTPNALADLIQIIQRTASMALNLVSDSGREWTLKRGFSQALALASNGERMLGAVRMASQSLTASMNVERVFSAVRGVSQTLTTTMNANRAFTAIRTASQTLITAFNGTRIWSTLREVSQSLTTTLDSNRAWSAVRGVSQSLTTTLNADRIFTAVRTASQSLTTTLNGNRVFTAIRSASQTLTASISASRTWDLSRTASQAITFASDALADLMKFFERTASLVLSLVSDSSRNWTLKRILTQSMTFASNIQVQLFQGYTYFHRYVSMALNLALDSKRTWGISRNVSQTITFASSALGDLLEFFSRSVSLTLNFVSSVIARTQMWLLSLFVTDFDDIPMENATVALTRNNSEATSYWKTYANGSIPDQLLSPDDYFLMISKYNYLTNETWVSLTGNYTLGILMEGAWIETNPEILGLFGVCLILQLCYAYGLYKGTQPTLTLTAGVLTALSWYTTGQVVLSFNQVQGVPIALLLSGFSTVNVVLLFRIVYALMMHYQEA